MSNPAILAFVAAIFGGALALGVAWQGQRSLARWAFVAGALVLAIESLFIYLCLQALEPEAGVRGETFIQWQKYKLLAGSFAPGVWLFFSLCYARGNSKEFLAEWKYALGTAFVIPIGLAFW